jgi:hypothetical protein
MLFYVMVLRYMDVCIFTKKLLLSLTGFAKIITSGYGSVWLERTAGGREVAGSNPVTPIFNFCF